MTILHLRSAGVSVVVDVSTGVPTITHWGADLGDVDPATVGAALMPPVAVGGLDVLAPLTIMPGHGDGFAGAPAIEVHRSDGTAWAPRFTLDSVDHRADSVVVVAVDPVASIRVAATILLDPHGALNLSAVLTNNGRDILWVDRVDLVLPVSADATEIITFGGRWANEFQPDRRAWPRGTSMVESRLGRTSHESPPLVAAGTPGFGEWSGEVWMAHLAWSGNHRIGATRLADGRRHLWGGDLFHPGEVSLEPGESVSTPVLIGSWSGAGLGEAARRFHDMVRAMAPLAAARARGPRPVSLNTWEAVYFDHDPSRLHALAERAASVGVERFILDDGWFGDRRSDRAGLGDWTVSPVAHPGGLDPLIDHVHGLGMSFGIWVEPEMVNEDSDLHRAHPEWTLETPGYPSVRGRGQLVVDLGRRDAFDHILDALDSLLSDHRISYVKWDHNRPLVQGSGNDGRAGSRRQTLAFYELLDELRARHPGVEFESCSGGGGRIDLGVLQRCERVWVSDCNDALDRQRIQRGASLLLPPEVMGCHIGPPTAHTTGRTHPLSFRAATAFFGHLGIEWNLLECTDDELDQVSAVVALHKTHRALLHSGDTVRFDPVDETGLAGGVYSLDRREALVSYARMASGSSLTPAPLRLPGLIADAEYEVAHVRFPGETWGMALSHPDWPAHGITLTGAQLAGHGLQLPVIPPERAFVFHLRAL